MKCYLPRALLAKVVVHDCYHIPLQVSWQGHGVHDNGLVVAGCQVYGRVHDLLDILRPVLFFQSPARKRLLLVSVLLGDLLK